MKVNCEFILEACDGTMEQWLEGRTIDRKVGGSKSSTSRLKGPLLLRTARRFPKSSMSI